MYTYVPSSFCVCVCVCVYAHVNAHMRMCEPEFIIRYLPLHRSNLNSELSPNQGSAFPSANVTGHQSPGVLMSFNPHSARVTADDPLLHPTF